MTQPITISIAADDTQQAKRCMECIWTAMTQLTMPEKSTQPFKLRDYTVMVRRGEGNDFGAVTLDN